MEPTLNSQKKKKKKKKVQPWHSSLSADNYIMIFNSKLPAREFPQVTLYDLLFESNKKFYSDRPCYIDAEDHSQSITFGQVKDIAYKFAAGIQYKFPDFKKGDVVAFYSGNNVSFRYQELYCFFF